MAKIVREFEVLASEVDESAPTSLSPEEIASQLAIQKAETVLLQRPDSLVIGADTIVTINGAILGKPESANEAVEMLTTLSGKEHEVITGVCVMTAIHSESFVEVTRVTFRDLSDSEIRSYVETSEPMDKAGAYAIQGGAANFVKSIQGDYDNVVGLPVTRLAETLSHLND